MRRISIYDDMVSGLDALCQLDPRLAAVRNSAGEIPLRRSKPGFAGLVAIIVSQQVSQASASAILGRLTGLVEPMTPEALLEAGEPVWRQAGLSRPKQRTLAALSRAVIHDGLDLHHLCDLDAAEAIGRMTEIPGIGPWTAEVYLLFAAGHPDIFPARDVALQSAVAHAFNIDPRPDEKNLAAIAGAWKPWRGVAAHLFWAYYKEIKGREAIPLS